jgi:6,7-dimethyl-8-ribityllumazine synthase
MKVEKKTAASGKLKARLLILEARYYADLCDELVKGAIAAIERAAPHGIVVVPGALELPGPLPRRKLQALRWLWHWAVSCAAKPQL